MNGECEKNNPYTLLGFHAGPRTCIGKHIALLELKIALILFLRRYKNIELSCQKLKGKFGFGYET